MMMALAVALRKGGDIGGILASVVITSMSTDGLTAMRDHRIATICLWILKGKTC